MESEDLRIAVYDRLRHGRIPTVTVLSDDLAVTPDEVRAGLQTLAGHRHLALSEDGEITMAHPFTAVPLGFSAMGQDTLWWGGCAWDSFALPHLLPDESPVLVATTCPACDTPHARAWTTGNHRPANRSHTSWSQQATCGTTSYTPAGTSESSAPRTA